jgi:UPF0755 protein
MVSGEAAKSGVRRFLVFAAAGFVLAGLAAGGVSFWLWQAYRTPGSNPEPIRVIVPKGEGLQAIALRLRDAGVVEATWPLVAAAWVSGAAGSLRAGEYSFEAYVSPKGVMAALTEGLVIYRRVTVTEGTTVGDVMALLAATDGLTDTQWDSPPPPPAEGNLLPETYLFSYGDSRADLLGRMQASMRQALASAWAARAEGLPYRSPEEALIMASIIEKETAVPDERGKIASVFVNRLRRGMALQSDPTVIYGLAAAGIELDRPLTFADLGADTPWNTYLRQGLPPSPIANPGRASISAALSPEITDYLYFVADGSGGHVFAATLAEHNKNVAKWRRHQRDKNHEAQK